MRWNHPERGLVAPGEFIPVAEESGAILAIGERVLRLACAEAAAVEPRASERAAAASRSTCRRARSPRPASPTLVASVLARPALDPAALTLEITEGVLVTESEATAQTLLDLKALGLRLVLDDFGTGYSSLAYLRRFPIDGLKIDRRFIAAMDTSTQDRTIVEAIVKMAAGLQIDVVAEGVETRRAGREPDRASAASTPRASTTRGRCPATTWPAVRARAAGPAGTLMSAPAAAGPAAGRLRRRPTRSGTAAAIRRSRPGGGSTMSSVSVASTTFCASARFHSSSDHWSRRPRTVSRTDAFVIPTAPAIATSAEARPVRTKPVSYRLIRCGRAIASANSAAASAIVQRR